MKLPRRLENEIIAAVRRKSISFSSVDVQDIELTVDDSFFHHGKSGAEIQCVVVSGIKNTSKPYYRFVLKPWESTKWLVQLMGVERPLENILFENGFFEDVNAIKGLHVPIVGSVRLGKTAWIIMEDVSEELVAWKVSAFESFDLALQCELLDRISYFHVKQEHNKHGTRLQSLKRQLVPQERRLRWFEQVCREWLVGKTSSASDSLALQNAKGLFSEIGREAFFTFLEHLPKESRKNWQKHMLNRDGLVTEASKLPVTLLHGDLLWKNIGLRREALGNTFVLIDWEIATMGHPAFDVYYFISEPFRSVDVWDELFDYYFDRYLFYGGSDLNRDQWNRGLEIAIAHYGLSWLPLFAEWARNSNNDKEIIFAENIIERTDRALHNVPI